MIFKRIFSNTNIKIFSDQLIDYDWNITDNNNDVDKDYDDFFNKFKNKFDTVFTKKLVTPQEPIKNLWMNN